MLRRITQGIVVALLSLSVASASASPFATRFAVDHGDGLTAVSAVTPQRHPRRARTPAAPQAAASASASVPLVTTTVAGIPRRHPQRTPGQVVAGSPAPAANAPGGQANAYAPADANALNRLFRAANSAFTGTQAPPPVTSQAPAVASTAGSAPAAPAAARPAPQKAAARQSPEFKIAAFQGRGETFTDFGRQRSDLKGALDALRADRYDEVYKRRNGLSDPLDRLIVDYFLIRSGHASVTPAMVADFAKRAPEWPRGEFLRGAAEAALSRQSPNAATVERTLGGKATTSTGRRLLARAALQKGDRRRATALVRTAWREETLGAALQSAFVKEFSDLMTADDHLDRIDMLVVRGRYSLVPAVRSRLGSGSRAYVDARVAASRGESKAGRLMKAVPSNLRRREGYRLAEISLLRRAGAHEKAARLLRSAPGKVANGDGWWDEARIVARHLAEDGKARAAAEVVKRDFAESRLDRLDEAFHRGWLALSAKDLNGADRGFTRLASLATNPISIARAAYWRGRVAEARGDNGTARRHYADAGEYGFTYYGQLARVELGRSGTGVGRGPNISASDRAAIRAHPVARALKRLDAVGHEYRSWPLLRHLARTVPTAGQAALVVDMAHEAKLPHLATMTAKAAQRRGLDIGRVAHPTGVIPKSAKVPRGVDRAVVYAIARQESLFNPGAVSPAGARGLMQVMPGTAKAMARELGLRHSLNKLTADPAYNATLGAAYLQKRLAQFDGSYIMTFAAYNAGAGKVREWVGRFGDPRSPTVDPIEWVERIPYPETRNYVMRVLENVQVYREALGTGQLAIDRDLVRGRRG